MKRKKNLTVKKVLFYIFIITVAVIYILVQLLKSNKTPHSFKNPGYFGNALYYDTLKELGYQVDYEINPIEKIQTNGLVVLNASSKNNPLDDQDYEKIMAYVVKGGKMLVLFPQDLLKNQSLPPQQGGKEIVNEIEGQHFQKWQFESEGVLMYGDIEDLSNMTVTQDRELAYQCLTMIHPYIEKEGIVFNEYYLYVNHGKRSLWKEMPQGVRYTLLQLLLVFLLFIGLKGKRFGAPLKLYEEAEPDENQYAKAVGSLYYQTGHWEVLVETYYNHLIAKIYRKYLIYMDVREENWISVFENKKEREYKAALKVFNFMKEYRLETHEKKPSREMKKKIKDILISIQYLEKSIDQN